MTSIYNSVRNFIVRRDKSLTNEIEQQELDSEEKTVCPVNENVAKMMKWDSHSMGRKENRMSVKNTTLKKVIGKK